MGIVDKITGCSGLSLTRVYLEEDQDGTLLYQAAKEKGVNVVCKSGYNLSFNVTHNYKPELFNWTPTEGAVVEVSGREYKVQQILKTKLLVTDAFGNRYRIPLANPFKLIQNCKINLVLW